ncbi:MAG: peptidoglycan-binding domain-containing protein, partial [Pseudanabaenaceae cyanobacterium]
QAQAAYNLTVDGVAGPQTVAALEKDQRPEPMPQNKPVEPSTEAKPVPESTVALVSSSQVAEAQKLMTELGFYQGAIDGIAGPATITAVKRAQAFYGLPVDGVIGPNTLQSLRA